jgi:hypothetical protein
MRGSIAKDKTEKVVRDDEHIKIKIAWNGKFFSVTEFDKLMMATTDCIILEPAEMMELIKFTGTLGEEC